MAYSVVRCDLHQLDLRTRMPFRYGIATMTQMPIIFVRVALANDRQESIGLSSDLLPPKWFTKIPDKAPDEEIREMRHVIERARQTLLTLTGKNVFDLWYQLYEAQGSWAQSEKMPPLLAHFGTSLMERALIDAACRAEQTPFHELLRQGTLGLDLHALHSELGDLNRLLPSIPRGDVLARHTVGLGDPLTDDEIAPDQRLHDHLPQSLQACIGHYGLRHFKIKVAGQPEQDLERLQRVAAILARETRGSYAFSLDGNEQFQSMESFQAFWEKLQARPELQDFLDRLMFVEQPLHRNRALQPEVGATLRRWSKAPALIIDESDASVSDARLALDLGYAGTSHKNCKGVFKGIGNRCLLIHRQRSQPDREFLMSGEDLCNMGPVALLQDLAVMGALGIESVERNGHHYNAGLSQFPKPIQEAVLSTHPDLYQRSPAGWPTLRIEKGRISLNSINAAPFGMHPNLTEAVAAGMPLA